MIDSKIVERAAIEYLANALWQAVVRQFGG